MVTPDPLAGYLRTIEVARIFGVQPNSITRLARLGELESIGGGQAGYDRFFSKESVKERMLAPVLRYEQMTGEELLK